MKTEHFIYWWNLENLFDVANSKERPEWIQKQIKRELKGWTSAVLDKKIANIASILQKMNDGKGPDILGVCEIENEAVVQRLMDRVGKVLNRTYKVLHHDSKDKRGIDIAIIYDTAKYEDDGRMFSLEVMKRNATRNLFQVNLTTKAGNELILIGNHWPARLGGQYESEPYRMMVGEILSYWIERIHEIKWEYNKDKNPAIIVMGDFNDEPFNRSLTEYLRTTGNIEKVKNSTSHILYNLMYQFIVSKSLIVNSSKYPFQVKKTEIVHFPEMVKGDYNTPIRFSRPNKRDYNPNGFSDHLPIKLVVEE